MAGGNGGVSDGRVRRRRIVALEASDYVFEKLLRKGLSLQNAAEVLNGSPKFLMQAETIAVDASGHDRSQPARLIMIGPDRGGRLLTFVLDLPDDERVSQVVTGWEADEADRSSYAQGGGIPIWRKR